MNAVREESKELIPLRKEVVACSDLEQVWRSEQFIVAGGKIGMLRSSARRHKLDDDADEESFQDNQPAAQDAATS